MFIAMIVVFLFDIQQVLLGDKASLAVAEAVGLVGWILHPGRQ